MGNPRANDGDCGAQDALLKARWLQVKSDPGHADLDFIVDVVFHKWDALARVLPKDSGDSGQRFYTANDINRFSHDWRTYKLRCRAALVEWVQGHNDPDNGPSQLLEALKVAGLGALTGKILSGLHPSRPKLENLQIQSSTQAETGCGVPAKSKELLRCISSGEIRRLPNHPVNKSGALGMNTSVAMWQGALVSLKEFGLTVPAVPGQSSDERLTNLRQDCHALSLLRHPSILAIYGLHAPKTGELAMVMEAMETTLYCRCRLQPKLLYADVLFVLIQVVSALIYVEDMGAVLTELCTKSVFLLKTYDSRYIAKVGGHAVPQNTLQFNRRSSAPHHLAAPEPAELLHQRQMKRSVSAGTHGQDNARAIGTIMMEALLGGELVGNNPQRWVADLSRQELDAQFTHLLSKCLDRMPGAHRMTTSELFHRLEGLSNCHGHPAAATDKPAMAAVPEGFLQQANSSGPGQVNKQKEQVISHLAEKWKQRSAGEKKTLYSESSTVDYSPPAVQPNPHLYGSDSCASDASSLYSVSSADATEDVQARGSRCRIRIEQAADGVVDEIPVTWPSYQQQIHASGFVSTSPTSPTTKLPGVTPSFPVVTPSFPVVTPSFPVVTPSFPVVTPSFPVAQSERRTTPELDVPSPDQSSWRSALVLPAASLTSGHRDGSPSGSVLLPATTGVTTAPEEVNKDSRSSAEAGHMDAALSSEQSGATMWTKFRLRAISVGSFRRKKAPMDLPSSASLALVRKDLHGNTSTGGSRRFLFPSESSADRTPVAANPPQDEDNHNNSFDVPVRQTAGVKCFGRYSHIAADHQELTMHCGEPLLVWQGDAGSDQSETFYARSSISGNAGVVSPDNVVPLKRVKRRLHAYSFQLQPQHEVERVKRLLEEKLSDEALPQFCDVLLKEMYPNGGYKVVSNHCRTVHGPRYVFVEMFKRWRNQEGANGLEYFEAAKVVGDGYQYHVLSILNVLHDP